MKQTIHIIGGGLAGLSLAIGLRRHEVPVVVYEAGNYPRHRVCGEFILGVSDADLTLLGIEDCVADAQRHRQCAWFAGNDQVALRSMPMAARAISRFELDQRLANHATQLGVEIRCGTRCELPRHRRLGAGDRTNQTGRRFLVGPEGSLSKFTAYCRTGNASGPEWLCGTNRCRERQSKRLRPLATSHAARRPQAHPASATTAGNRTNIDCRATRIRHRGPRIHHRHQPLQARLAALAAHEQTHFRRQPSHHSTIHRCRHEHGVRVRTLVPCLHSLHGRKENATGRKPCAPPSKPCSSVSSPALRWASIVASRPALTRRPSLTPGIRGLALGSI